MIALDPSVSPLVVIDASVALAWTLPDTEDNHRFAAEVLDLRDAGYTLVVPGTVFTTEVAYVLLKHGRREREGEAMTAERAEFIEQFIDQEYQLRARASSLVRYAVRHNVQGFDAVYLALAEHVGAQLATLDGGLRSAARNCDIWVLT